MTALEVVFLCVFFFLIGACVSGWIICKLVLRWLDAEEQSS